MTIKGYQFDKAKLTPEADAQLYSYLAQDMDNKVLSGLNINSSGLNIYVDSGKALVQGRLVEVTQQHQLLAQANKSGFVCITIDLTQDNTATGTPGTSSYVPVNNQLKLELVDTLVQQNLSSGGLIYTFPIFKYTSNGTSVSVAKIDDSYRYLNTDWTNFQSYGMYKISNSRVSISFDIKGNGGNYMQFGMLPKNLIPASDKWLVAASNSASVSDNRHIQVRASDGAVVLWTPNSGTKYQSEVSYTL